MPACTRARRLIRRRCVPRPDGASGSLLVKPAKPERGVPSARSAAIRQAAARKNVNGDTSIPPVTDRGSAPAAACGPALEQFDGISAIRRRHPLSGRGARQLPRAAFPRAARSPGLTYATCLLRSLPVATQSRRPYAPPRCRRIRFLRPRDPPFRRTPAHRNRAHATRPQHHPGKPGA